MNYFAIALVTIVPTVIAFWYFLSRPHLGVWRKVIIFVIWFITSIPLAPVIYFFSIVLYIWGAVGQPVLWDTGVDVPLMAAVLPVSVLLNGYLALITYWWDSHRSGRSAEALQ